MAAVTICSDFGAPQNKVDLRCMQIYLHFLAFKIYAPNFQIYDILSLANSLGIAILNDYLLFLHPYSVWNSSLDILSFDFVQQCHWVDTVIIHILKMRPRFSKVTDLTKVTQSALSIIIPGVWVSETTDLA